MNQEIKVRHKWDWLHVQLKMTGSPVWVFYQRLWADCSGECAACEQICGRLLCSSPSSTHGGLPLSSRRSRSVPKRMRKNVKKRYRYPIKKHAVISLMERRIVCSPGSRWRWVDSSRRSLWCRHLPLHPIHIVYRRWKSSSLKTKQ